MTDLVKQITELYEQDVKSARLAKAPEDLPINYESMTPEWLTHILCKGHPGAEVTDYSLDHRDDGSANRRRVFLKYNSIGQAAGLPASVFCKASHDLLNRINLGICGAAHGEVTFYNKVRPLLDLDLPKAIFAAYDARSFNSLVMLQDLGGKVEFCNYDTNISRRDVESQLSLIAQYHGQLQESATCNSKTTTLPTWPEFFRACCSNGVEEWSNKGFLAAKDVIPIRLYARYEEIWPATVRSVDIHATLPSTLLHGDCHLKQWYKNGGHMGLGDWQNTAFGNWSRDFAYMLTTSLEVEDRRNWDKELLKFYLDKVAKAGGRPPSFDKAWDLYRINLLSALCWWTVTLTPSPGMPEMQPREASLQFIRRISHAIDDLDAMDLFAH